MKTPLASGTRGFKHPVVRVYIRPYHKPQQVSKVNSAERVTAPAGV